MSPLSNAAVKAGMSVSTLDGGVTVDRREMLQRCPLYVLVALLWMATYQEWARRVKALALVDHIQELIDRDLQYWNRGVLV